MVVLGGVAVSYERGTHVDLSQSGLDLFGLRVKGLGLGLGSSIERDRALSPSKFQSGEIGLFLPPKPYKP